MHNATQADSSAIPIGTLLQRQQQAFMADGLPDPATRIDRLQRLRRMLGEHQRHIVDACVADFGSRSRHQAQMSEIFAVMEDARRGIKGLGRWMKPAKRKAPFPQNLLGARAWVEYVPKGVVGILGTWNFPLYTALSPLAGVLAAGNRAMIKFSELTPATAGLVCRLLGEYFHETELAGVTGGPEVGAEFAALPFDHIIFTGGTGIGRHILRAAVDNLTPCTLELGGKSPVIVGRSFDPAAAARHIMTGKALNQGQACLAPDYCFVPRESLDAFVEAATAHYSTLFPTIADNPDVTSVINRRHYDRLRHYIEDARAKGARIHEINPARERLDQQASGVHKLPMTLVLEPGDDMVVMQEEIFGPILAIKGYRDVAECIRYINGRPRPLGLYYFGHDAGEQRQVLERTISGGVTINDVMQHVNCDDLPFGGIGFSGMGAYHGQDGFRTFSHARAVYRQTRVDLMKLAGMLPPYTEKCTQQLDKMCRLD